jgi:hypothetical protein
MAASIVDSTFRWGLVLFLALAFLVSLFPGAYAKGFPSRPQLRAPFGFMVPDTSPHGYGWGLVFGYAWVLANAALLLVGAAMVAIGKVPPWISGAGKGAGTKGQDPPCES